MEPELQNIITIIFPLTMQRLSSGWMDSQSKVEVSDATDGCKLKCFAILKVHLQENVMQSKDHSIKALIGLRNFDDFFQP